MRINTSLFLVVVVLLFDVSAHSQTQPPQQSSTAANAAGPAWAYLKMPGYDFEVPSVARKGRFYLPNDPKQDTKLYFLPPLVQREINIHTHAYCTRSEASDKSTVTYRCAFGEPLRFYDLMTQVFREKKKEVEADGAKLRSPAEVEAGGSFIDQSEENYLAKISVSWPKWESTLPQQITFNVQNISLTVKQQDEQMLVKDLTGVGGFSVPYTFYLPVSMTSSSINVQTKCGDITRNLGLGANFNGPKSILLAAAEIGFRKLLAEQNIVVRNMNAGDIMNQIVPSCAKPTEEKEQIAKKDNQNGQQSKQTSKSKEENNAEPQETTAANQRQETQKKEDEAGKKWSLNFTAKAEQEIRLKVGGGSVLTDYFSPYTDTLNLRMNGPLSEEITIPVEADRWQRIYRVPHWHIGYWLDLEGSWSPGKDIEEVSECGAMNIKADEKFAYPTRKPYALLLKFIPDSKGKEKEINVCRQPRSAIHWNSPTAGELLVLVNGRSYKDHKNTNSFRIIVTSSE